MQFESKSKFGMPLFVSSWYLTFVTPLRCLLSLPDEKVTEFHMPVFQSFSGVYCGQVLFAIDFF